MTTPCPPECQVASNAYMELRKHADKVEVCALNALTKMRLAKTAMMGLQDKMLGMETGQIEALLYEIASVSGKARQMHNLSSKVMRQNGFALPVPPTYGEYALPEEVKVQIKVPERR